MKKLLLLITLVVFYGAAFGQRGVGIGVSSPTEKLHVVGNFRLEGAFMPGNQSGTNGQLLHSAGVGNTPAWLPQGTTGQFLQSNGAGALPTWVDAPQGGGGSFNGCLNYVARYRPNATTLGCGLAQDDSIQFLIRATSGLPYANRLNYLSIIESINTGQSVLNTQRAALCAISQDSLAILGLSFSADARGSAIRGQSNGIAGGVSGVFGTSGLGSTSQFNYGVWGQTNATPAGLGGVLLPGVGLFTAAGVYGVANADGISHGVQGLGLNDQALTSGVYGEALPLNLLINGGQIPLQAGVIGLTSISAPTGSPQSGVWGIADTYEDGPGGEQAGAGFGLRGMTLGGAGIGVLATAVRAGDPTAANIGANYGVWAEAQATEEQSAGVRGMIYKTINNGVPDGTGVNGDGFGVWGENYQETDSSAGVRGDSYATSGGIGVYGVSDRRIGVIGFHSATTGFVPGVLGYTNSTTAGASGVKGLTRDGETYGVFGETESGTQLASGVYGYASAPNGVVYGVTGITESGDSDAAGVAGIVTATSNQTTFGVYGETNSTGDGVGVYGRSSQNTGQGVGVLGVSATTGANGIGVLGRIQSADATAAGVFGEDDVPGPNASTSWAGWFNGNVNITGALEAPTKNFLIDHPVDPTNKYLRHACIESNEILNVYSGNVTTDANGVAIVRMPNYFQALNVDFRYQLTTIGQFADAIVSKKLENNVFEIKTDKPNVEVSWQVTGKRNDPYVQRNPLVVEQDKEPENRGKYLIPSLYGQPDTKAIGVVPTPTRDLQVSIPPKEEVKKVDPTQGTAVRKPNTTALEVRKHNDEAVRLLKERNAQNGGKKLDKEQLMKRLELIRAQPVKE